VQLMLIISMLNTLNLQSTLDNKMQTMSMLAKMLHFSYQHICFR